ncbi:Maf family protein [uncultured Peptoniphilus sp.]|uniref:Maf family protein n=1 Tax=uncultured Peptoniphilus sp. TaxID=254354 RepID=UPI0028062DD8|nr:Maf family protein [uncultured Peptoniphilus sp.]
MKIILGSGSSGRREVLEKFTDFDVEVSKLEEKKDYKDIKILTMALSFEKAYSVSQNHKDALVIGADTMISFEGKNIGKAKDYEEAFQKLRDFSGKTHEIYTGFSLIYPPKNFKYTDYEKTLVTFKSLSDREIHEYLKTGEYIGKAGSYSISERGGLLISSICGDYNNVIGLPITKINEILIEYLNINLMGSENLG